MTIATKSKTPIKIDVDFYDVNEKQELLKYPSAKKLQQIVNSGIDVTTTEFLTYYLFYKKRPGKRGYRGYRELSRRISNAIAEIEDWVDISGTSILIPTDVGNLPNSMIERIGESVGLSVINRAHGLSDADWDKLKELPGKKGKPTFDYEIASDGTNIIQVENKGSYVVDNRVKSPPLSNHKRNIKNKKQRISALEAQNKYPYPAALRYGTITAVDSRPNTVTKCFLVDPDPDTIEMAARDVKLLNRMQFLFDWISLIRPKSILATALATRLADLREITDPFELDGIPLRRGSGSDLNADSWLTKGPGGQNKSGLDDGSGSGTLLQLSDGPLYFLGILDELPILAAEQEFENILNFNFNETCQSRTVKCVVRESRFEKMDLPAWLELESVESDGYRRFKLDGLIRSNSDGVIFGALPVEN